jgi:hypothetical protein
MLPPAAAGLDSTTFLGTYTWLLPTCAVRTTLTPRHDIAEQPTTETGIALDMTISHYPIALALGLCCCMVSGASLQSSTDDDPLIVVGDDDTHPVAMAGYLRTIRKTDTPPTIDGVLDDDVWLLAEPITNFTQVVPAEGAVPSERTEMRLLYDQDNLYIAFRFFDSQPDSIVAAQMQRDISLNTDDHVTIIIDPFDRARSGYEFQVSAAGGRRDGLVETDAATNYDWRGLWSGRVTRDELGWTAEIAIPFKTISFDPNAEKWGFNVERYIPRTNE